MRIKMVVITMLLCCPAMAADWDKRQFAECLSKSGAKYYGAHWCPYCKKQSKMFGRDKKYLPYIECSKKGGRKKLSKCKHIKGYPTWTFANGTSRSGLLDFKTLSIYTGCELHEKKLFIIKEI